MKIENKKIGDCECCTATEIEVTLHYGNMWMCDTCWSKEKVLLDAAKEVKVEQQHVNKMLAESERIDSSAELKTDLFNAATIAMVELEAAIDNDSEITNKDFAKAEAAAKRVQHFKSLIFDKRKELNELENVQRAQQSRLQVLASRIREEERKKLQIESPDYAPAKPKSAKPASERKPSAGKMKLDELKQAAEKVGLPADAVSGIRSIMIAKNLNALDAAKHLKEMIG